MDWIEQNLDAYRVIAEILTDLRPLVRERLEARHGKEWFRDGIPTAIFERLIQNKEQEASIDWYENRYQEVISYAVFPDLYEIIIANPGLFDPVLKLAPSQSLLNTRFLELEVMRSKIGRARQVSEAEIGFLTSFHLRFRRAVQELIGDDSVRPAPGKPTAKPPKPEESAPEKPPERAAGPESPKVDSSADPDATETVVKETPGSSGRPPMRMASPASAGQAEDKAEAEVELEPEPDAARADGPAEAPGEPPPRETVGAILKRAMEKGDDRAVLREIYREVTGIAEVIWTTNEHPTTAVWERVSTNKWYEQNFSRLGLRPLSDFYELISQVREKRKGGAAKAEIQSFLNDSKFATILLALRDMFQSNNI
ncbi:MAG: hypothetical protein AB1Z65_00035 [Candidatus Sulfomarinibacteraceae bacterium]